MARCKHCDSEFEKAQTFCSRACANRFKNVAKTKYRTATCAECGSPFRARWDHDHYAKFCSTECYGAQRHVPIERRFWMKVDQSSGPLSCWHWTAKISPHGYGRVGLRGPVQVQAHRIAYELTHGPIPVGKIVCHSCDNRRCCNPAHLWIGTKRDNTQDALSKRRLLQTPTGVFASGLQT